MKHYLTFGTLFLMLSFSSYQAIAQENTSNQNTVVQFCMADKIFTVKALKDEENYRQFQVPDKSPTYKGGGKKIEKFLNANLKLEDKQYEIKFIPVYVYFIVNCEGRAGNFSINISETFKEDGAYFQQQFLKLFEAMPQSWKPALKNDERVDCYQTIVFSLTLGAEKNNGVKYLSYF